MEMQAAVHGLPFLSALSSVVSSAVFGESGLVVGSRPERIGSTERWGPGSRLLLWSVPRAPRPERILSGLCPRDAPAARHSQALADREQAGRGAQGEDQRRKIEALRSPWIKSSLRTKADVRVTQKAPNKCVGNESRRKELVTL